MHIQVGHKREPLCPPTARTTAANMKRKDAMERWESKRWRQSKAETPKDHDFWMFCPLFGSKSTIRIFWRFRKIGLLRNHRFWGTPVVENPPVVGWGTGDQWGTPLTSYHGKPWMIFPERGVPQVIMGLNTKVVVMTWMIWGTFFFGQNADKTSTDVNFEYWIVRYSQHLPTLIGIHPVDTDL